LDISSGGCFFWWAWRRKKGLIALFVQSRLLAQLTVGVSARRQKARMGMMVVSATLLLLVLARPQWGYEWEDARQRGLDIIVAIDTSRSMLATDVPPNRLDRAKLAAQDLLRLARTDRLGLIAFAGGAFLQCPLTIDNGAFQQSLAALDTSIIPQGGTALNEAIAAARSAFGGEENENFKILVLFTDGEDHDGNAVQAARSAASEGMRIFTIGVGTPEGELLSIPDPDGGTTFLKDDRGNVVKSRLDETLLQEVAQAAGGFYMLLSGANTIDVLYERGLDPLPKAEFATKQIQRYHERYQWFLGLAMMLLVMEMLMPEQRRAVRSPGRPDGATAETASKAVGLMLLMALPFSTLGASSSKASKQYEKGDYQAAYEQYNRLLEKRPDDPRLHFNAASAAHRAGDLEAARHHFQSAMVTKDLALQEAAYYGLGNTQYRLGAATNDLEQKQKAWQSALTHYQSALKLNETDEDARSNLEFVKKKLEELQQQKDQQQDQENQENKDDEQKQEQEQKSDSQENKDSSEEQKSDEQKSEEQKQEPEGSKPEDQESQEGQKPEPGDQKPAEQGEPGDESKEPQQAQQGQPMVMTPQEAQRLLDSLKGQERALIFLPPNMTNRSDRVKRNW